MMKILFGLFVIILIVNSSAVDDLVSKDYLKTINITMESDIYSGYLPVNKDGSAQFHYFLVYKDKTLPLTLWLNGGPGCSSAQGLFNENGPYSFIPTTDQLKPNPYAWNQISNMLFLESPVNVGFSYGPSQHQNDQTTAYYNLQALIQFFQRFPEFQNLEFYISGESYAGIYIPNLASQIIDYNVKAQQKINLKGVLIGNGCTDPTECTEEAQSFPIHQYDFIGKHNLISEEIYQLTKDNAANCYGSLSDECLEISRKVFQDFQGSQDQLINPYNVYGDCPIEIIPLIQGFRFTQSKIDPMKYLFHPELRENAELPPCADVYGLYSLFYNTEFKNAFHISNKSPKWNVCSNIQYTSDSRASYYLYPKLIKNGLRVWKFSGDNDAVVPITGTLYWINKIQNEYDLRTIIPWRPWYVTGTQDSRRQNGGNYFKISGLTFVSVRGAGHMVPTDQGHLAFEMFSAFIKNQDLPAQ